MAKFSINKAGKTGNSTKKSGSGIGAGFLMIIGAAALCIWNEKDTVKTARTIRAFEKTAVELDISSVNPEFEGKNIHATGNATTSDTLTDNTYFGIARNNAIKLIGEPEYYQVGEEETIKDNDTTYSYKSDWYSKPKDSQKFHKKEHQNDNSNPILFPDLELNLQAENVSFGAYKLSADLVRQMSQEKAFDVTLSDEMIAKLNQEVKALYPQDTTQAHIHIIDGKAIREGDAVKKNVIYIGSNPRSPQIGDMKVTITEVLPGEVSILSQVKGDSFVKYYNEKYDKTINKLSDGSHSKDKMIKERKESNRKWAWVWRIVGLILFYLGFKSLFGLLDRLTQKIPILSGIVNFGTSLVAAILAFSVWTLVVAVSFLWYRPVLGIALIIAIIAIILLFAKMGKKKKAMQAAEAAPEQSAE